MRVKKIADTISYSTTIGAGIGFFAAIAQGAQDPDFGKGYMNLDVLIYLLYPSIGAGAGFALGCAKAGIDMFIEFYGPKNHSVDFHEHRPR